EHERPAQLLLGVADVQPQAEMHLDGFVELGRLELLERADGLDRRVQLLAVDLSERLAISLAVLAHLSTSTPIERAVPATTSIAASTSRAFRSSSLTSAMPWSCLRVRRPTFSRFGSPEPFSMFSASLIRTAAGGVL